MASEYLRMYSVSLAIGEMQIKAVWRLNLTRGSRMAASKKANDKLFFLGYGERVTSLPGLEHKPGQPL